MNGRLVEEDGAIPFVIVGVVALGGVLGLAWAGHEWAQLLVNEAGGELTVWVLRGAFWALDLVALQAATAPTTTDWATPVLDGPALPIWALAALVMVATLIAETVAGMVTGNTSRIVQAVGRALAAGMLATIGASLLLAVGGALSGLGRIALDASGAGVDAPLVPLQEVLMDTAQQRDSGAELFIAFLAGLVIVFTSLAIYFTLAMRPVLLAAIIVFLPVAHALAVWTPMRRIQARTWALALAVLLADAAILTMFAVTNTVIGQPQGIDRLIFGTFGLLLAALAPAALARIIGVPELQTAVQTMTRGSRAVAAGAGLVAAKGALLAAATARHTPSAGGGGGSSGGTPSGGGPGGPGPVSGATHGPAGGGTGGPAGGSSGPGGGSSAPAAASSAPAGSGASSATRGAGAGPAGRGTAAAPGVTANGNRATTGATTGVSSGGSVATEAGSGAGATTGSATAPAAAGGGEPAGVDEGHHVGGAVAGQPGAASPVGGATRAATSLGGGTAGVFGGETPGVSSSTLVGAGGSAGGSVVGDPAGPLSTPVSGSPAPTGSVGVPSATGPASRSSAASASAVPPSGPLSSAETADAPPSSRSAPVASAGPVVAAGQRSGPVAGSLGSSNAGAAASARPAGLQPPIAVTSDPSAAAQTPGGAGVVQPASESAPSSPGSSGWRGALTRTPSGVGNG
jgi:hypothetical protein